MTLVSSNVQAWSSTKVKLSLITKDVALQVRNAIHSGAVKRYAELIRNGKVLRPIKLASVDDVLFLVDGWHRLEAMESLGQEFADAEVIQANRQEAIWLAATANLEHGVQLKQSEFRNVFRAYIKSRQHLKGHRKVKSYREIGEELGKPHTTIRNWMLADYPEIAARMAGNEDFVGEGGLQAVPKQSPNEALQHLGMVREAFRQSSDPDYRGALISSLRVALTDMEASGGWTLPLEPEF
jgi:hypothetical protein